MKKVKINVNYKERYAALATRAREIEQQLNSEKGLCGLNRAYLVDENVDHQNAAVAVDHPEYWNRMVIAIEGSVGLRLVEMGENPENYGWEY